MKKIMDKMAASKKMQKPAKRVKQRSYVSDKEDYDRAVEMKELMVKTKPSGLAEAFNRAKQGYSKKPRVKLSVKKRYSVE